MTWMQPVCQDCWDRDHHDQPNRRPFDEREVETCCVCGDSTMSGNLRPVPAGRRALPHRGPDVSEYEYELVTCAKCGVERECTPWFDFYVTPLWDGEGRICEACFRPMMWASIRDEP